MEPRNESQTAPVPKDLNYLIYKHLTAVGIEIPCPQRDLHIRSGTSGGRRHKKKTTQADRRPKIHLSRPCHVERSAATKCEA